MAKKQTLKAERIELVDQWGRKVVEIGATNATPYVLRFNGKGQILSWLTFNVDGTADIRYFGDKPDQSQRNKRR